MSKQIPDWEILPIEGESKAERAFEDAKRRKRLADIAERNRVKNNEPISINPIIAMIVIVLTSYIALRMNNLDISCNRIESGVSCVLVGKTIDGQDVQTPAPKKPERPRWDF